MPAKMDKKRVQVLATGLLAMNVFRTALAEEMDAMGNIVWDLDPELKKIKWLHPKVSTDPHDALRAGTRALSAIMPNIKINEHITDGTTQDIMNKLETWAKIILASSDVKTQSSLVEDFVFSALCYDEVTVVVDYLPYHYDSKTLADFGEHEADRIRESLKEAPFDIKVFHPAQCFVNYDKFGVKGVLTRSIKRIDEVVSEHGKKKTVNLTDKAKEDEKQILLYCTYYDYSDTEYRYVWAIPQDSAVELSDPVGGYMVMRATLRTEPFLQWTSAIGGSSVTRTGQPNRIPLLYSIYMSGQWDDQNLLDSIEFSMVAAMAARPQLAIKNASGEIYKIDYWDPLVVLEIQPGDEIVPLSYNILDPALGALSQKEAARMEKSTVSRILMGTPPPGGVAFATMNLAAQTAGKTLTEYKEVAEQALAKVIKIMIKWMIFMKEDVKIPGYADPISWTLLPVNPKVKVFLSEDLPTDQMARINAAVQAIQFLGYSQNKALEAIGEDDPLAIIKEGFMEKMRQAEVMGRIAARQERSQMIAGLENIGLKQLTTLVAAGEPTAMQVLQALEQKLAQAAEGQTGQGQLPPGPTPGPGQNPENPENPPGMEGVEGSGFDPSKGGAPPAQANPAGATREGSTGKDRSNREIRK